MVKKHEEESGPSAFRLSTVFGGIVLILPFVVHFLSAYIAQFLATFAPEDAAVLQASEPLKGLVIYSILTLLLFFYLRASLEPLSAYGWTWRREHLALAVGTGIIAGVTMYSMDVASSYAFDLPLFSPMAFLTVVVGSALLPAIFEETLFRGVIQSAYTKITSKRIGALPAAVIIASAFEIGFHLLFPLYFGGIGTWAFVQLAYVALFGGMMFLSIYVLILSFGARDIQDILLGQAARNA